MGFRCPKCKRDFGTDKKSFEQHMQEENTSRDITTMAETNLCDIIKSSGMLSPVTKRRQNNGGR